MLETGAATNAVGLHDGEFVWARPDDMGVDAVSDLAWKTEERRVTVIEGGAIQQVNEKYGNRESGCLTSLRERRQARPKCEARVRESRHDFL